MSEISSSPYNSKLRYNMLDLNNFFNELENAIVQGKSLNTMKLPIISFDKHNKIEYAKQYDLDELKQIDEKYKRIIDHLEKNKYKIAKEKKIEIFGKWLYWISAANYNAWTDNLCNKEKRIYKEIFSFNYLHKTARSVLYEVDSLKSCYDYYNAEFELNAGTITGSILEEMYNQPDILCRAICSSSIENVKLLADNGYNLVKHYKHPKLKTSLHWAYYCDNLEIFKYLIENGCTFDENDIFYDPNHRKNFKFALYLHFYQEKRQDVYKSIQFDKYQVLTGYKLYEHFQNKNDIINLYENMFKLGFSLCLNTEVLNELLFRKDNVYINVTQYAICVCQANTSLFTIKYLKNKFINECKSDELMQDYLVNLIKHIIFLYCTSLNKDIYKKCNTHKISSSGLIKILSEVLPLLNKNSILTLNLFENTEVFILDIFSLLISTFRFEDKTILVEGSNEYSSYFYDRKSFKIIDLIISFNLLPSEYYFDYIIYEILDSRNFIENCDSAIEILALYYLYLLNNKYISSESLISSLKKVYHISLFDIIGPDIARLLMDTINSVINFNISLSESLVNLAKNEIRNSIQYISNDILSKLDLTIDALNEIRRTSKVSKESFYKFYFNKEKYIDKTIKMKFDWFN